LIGQLRNNNSNLDSSLLLQKQKTGLQENLLYKKIIKEIERYQVILKKEKNNGKLLQVIAQQDKRIIALEKDKAVLDNENFHLRKQIEKQDESFLRSNRLISKNQEHLWEMVLTFAKQGDVESRLGKSLRDVKSEFVETKSNNIKHTKKKKKKNKTCENKDTEERTKYYSGTSTAA